MTPFQQMLLGTVPSESKIYVDDVFNTVARASDGTTYVNSSGLNLSGEGGMVWTKSRSHATNNIIHDSIRGASYSLFSDTTNGSLTGWSGNNTFTSTGYSIAGGDGTNNASGYTYTDRAFRKSKGFFDVVQYSGTGSTQTLNHNLECVPGCIMIKRTDTTADWGVYHYGQHAQDPEDYRLRLNTNTYISAQTYWGNTAPTATQFTVGDAHTEVNASGATYVAYLFAGPVFSSNAVGFNGGTDRLTAGSNSDFKFGTSDFTIECFVKRNRDIGAYSRICHFGNFWQNNSAVGFNFDDGDHLDKLTFASYYLRSTGDVPANGRILVSSSSVESNVWYHVAVTRSSGVFRMFINGVLEDSDSSVTSEDLEVTSGSGNTLAIGGTVDRTVSEPFCGEISNFRILKGSALYTSNFTVPTKELTAISNTVQLCCQGATPTEVTSGQSLTANNNEYITSATISGDSTGSEIYGENSDEPIIRCGSYEGSGTTTFDTALKVEIGFEPQFLIVKNADVSGGSQNWQVFDTLRGYNADGVDTKGLKANLADVEETNSYYGSLTSEGFKMWETNVNVSGVRYIYIAVRASDGWVGKPADAGTDVFAMDTGNGSSTIPTYDSNFVVDFGLKKSPDNSSSSWLTGSRLIGTEYLLTNSNAAETDFSGNTWDSNLGWMSSSQGSTHMAWMWKRNKGFDVVDYIGSGSQTIHVRHNLAQVPEMFWTKRRDATEQWMVYHKDLNGGVNPNERYLVLNGDAGDAAWNWSASQPPTNKYVTFTTGSGINWTNKHNLMMLFASVTGISKVGSYDGTGSSLNITTGFQPRFLIIKRIDSNGSWFVLDTTRGWASGNDEFLLLNETSAQDGNYDIGEPTSTGFQLNGSDANYNASGNKYIYYAHA